MIFTLNILIDLCLIAAVYSLSKRKRVWTQRFTRTFDCSREVRGKLDKALVQVKMAERFSERAFSLASSANLACMALQRTLQVRPYASKQQRLANEIAQKEVKEAIGGPQSGDSLPDYSGFDWLYPVLSDEERDIVDKAIELSAKYKDGISTKS